MKSGASATQMLRSPLWSKIQVTRGACAAVVRPEGNGAVSTCSMVNASAKQQVGKRTETAAAQRSGVFIGARYGALTVAVTLSHSVVRRARSSATEERLRLIAMALLAWDAAGSSSAATSSFCC